MVRHLVVGNAGVGRISKVAKVQVAFMPMIESVTVRPGAGVTWPPSYRPGVSGTASTARWASCHTSCGGPERAGFDRSSRGKFPLACTVRPPEMAGASLSPLAARSRW